MIKGTAVNNDGAGKVGYLAPSVDGQAARHRRGAGGRRRRRRTTIGYVECHGTGTYLGDPIEVAALTQAFRAKHRRAPASAASARSRPTSAISTRPPASSSLIKAALALEHGRSRRASTSRSPTRRSTSTASPFRGQRRARPTGPRTGTRGAPASTRSASAARTRTSCVEEAPARAARREAVEPADQLLTLSARTRRRAATKRPSALAAHLREHPDAAARRRRLHPAGRAGEPSSSAGCWSPRAATEPCDAARVAASRGECSRRARLGRATPRRLHVPGRRRAVPRHGARASTRTSRSSATAVDARPRHACRRRLELDLATCSGSGADGAERGASA